MLKCLKKKLISSRDDLKTYILLKDTKNTALLIFNSLKQKKLIFNFFVNRNWNKITDSRKRAKILADNPKSHQPIETLLKTKVWVYLAVVWVLSRLMSL